MKENRMLSFIAEYLLMITLCLCVLMAKAQLSDVYMDVGVAYNTFVNKKEFVIDKNVATPGMLGGVGFYLNSDRKWKLLIEAGYHMRSFIKEYPHEYYQYRFPVLQGALLLEYPLADKLALQTGMAACSYQSLVGQSDVVLKKVGEGFRSFDLMLIGGAVYQIYKPIYLGARFLYGTVPMVKTRRIDNYGEISDYENRLNYASGEIFLRFKFINK